MFPQMLPWLIIAVLLGVVVGLIIGIQLGSSLLQRHFQVTQTPPLQRLQRGVTGYLDDKPYARPRR